MKSRRVLKKEIRKAFDSLYQDVIFYEAFVIKADKEKAQGILYDVVATEEDLIKRVSAYDGKHADGRVKTYFRKLNQDLKAKTNKLSEQITALPH